jgi:hypothetical protein
MIEVWKMVKQKNDANMSYEENNGQPYYQDFKCTDVLLGKVSRVDTRNPRD